ncbi:glycoside hydrolase [Schizopora paradoxa]|uniref:Alpha-galactosidase n=1 Tax=Schizopora paradoxa TaxID=27342 RepID=A0A0H2RQM5_9AGAM|nr:glycoside hydrolase [Schizopora paradoxa]
MISSIPLAVLGLISLTNGMHIRSSELAQEPWASQNAPSRAIGKLPALGWNTWNAYRCNINESNVLAAADQFISLGLKDAGYTYVNIDDCWSNHTRDSKGRLVVDNEKFPNGMSHVVDKIHSLGLKAGIYSDAGVMTCAKYPGSLGHEAEDATSFSEWGFDYLKYDNCNVPKYLKDTIPPDGDWFKSNSSKRFQAMSEQLIIQPRPIEYSLCIWGEAKVWQWGARVGHSWRILGDSRPVWDYIMTATRVNVEILDYVDFYSHNDMDMMEIGNGNLTIQEQRTHFAIWAFMKSPILIGTDMNKLSEEQLKIITNEQLLAFSQDETFGKPAKPFYNIADPAMRSPPEYYAGESSKGMHVFIINTGDERSRKSVDLASVPGLSGLRFEVFDMWTNEKLDVVEGRETFEIELDSHDTAALFVAPRKHA